MVAVRAYYDGHVFVPESPFKAEMNLPAASCWVSKILLRNLCVCGGTNPPHPQQ